MKHFMEQVKIEVDKDLSLALQKIHECQVIYLSTMGKYNSLETLSEFQAHCDCIVRILKEDIADNVNCKMEECVSDKYDKGKVD